MNNPRRNGRQDGRSERVSSRQGARNYQISFDSRWRAWVRHHRQVAGESARRLLKRPLSSLLTMLAIAIALVLPAALWLALGSAQLIDSRLDDTAQMTLYLDPALSESQAMDVADRVRQLDTVASTQFITAAEGLDEFQHSLGLDDALSMLQDNPLPASIVVVPVQRDPEAAQQLAVQLGALPGVDEARLDTAWLERLRQLGELGQRVVLAFAGLFGLGVLLVVGNTIRLAVESRREEIEVVTLIGATHAFVRRPFLYSGAWFGLGGGVLALMLLTIGRSWLSAPIDAVARSYGSHYLLPGLGFEGSVLLLICSTLLSWLGAWLAVGRHLAEIKPR
nr:permease-like cell division protein FtsX [Phytohalomonas tamaricis]